MIRRRAAGADLTTQVGNHTFRATGTSPHQRREAIKRLAAGEATRAIARSYNVSHSTIS
jgi:hypothetical protein